MNPANDRSIRADHDVGRKVRREVGEQGIGLWCSEFDAAGKGQVNKAMILSRLLPLLQGQSVLLVEDDQFEGLSIARQLAALGVGEVVTATDGPDAMRLLGGTVSFALVVGNLRLPGADQVELVRAIARLQPQAALVLIGPKDRNAWSAVTGVAKAHGLNVLGALERPVTAADLRALLQRKPMPDLMSVLRVPALFTPGELRAAIDHGEFYIHVQPKLRAATGELDGVEALARWSIPTLGMVPSRSFAKVAEQHGMIDDLTDLVLEKSLAACGEWNRRGLHTTIAVNMPVSSVQRLDLPERLDALAASHGVLPKQLIVEITEEGLAGESRKVLDLLAGLRLLGVGLALDDYGSGFSSMQKLPDLPFGQLKIDQAFIRAAIEDPEVRHFVNSSIQLAASLGLETVAEGVDSEAVWHLVADMGCDMVQGNWISGPLSAERFPAWWQQNATRFRRLGMLRK